jgi:1L-myo-inositol 1-phosphate cytidylyltransferase
MGDEVRVVKGLILAAGRGNRLGITPSSRPFVPVLGVPLIERVIRSAVDARVDEIYVTAGQNETGRLQKTKKANSSR